MQNSSLNKIILKKILSDREADKSIFSSVDPVVSYWKDHLLGIVIFGSAVRNERTKSSDIDLLIVLDQNKAIDRTLYSSWDLDLESRMGKEYSPQFSHCPDMESISSLWLEVAMEGEILYDPSEQIRKILRLIREKVAEGIYQRKMIHGHPYWVRKEKVSAK